MNTCGRQPDFCRVFKTDVNLRADTGKPNRLRRIPATEETEKLAFSQGRTGPGVAAGVSPAVAGGVSPPSLSHIARGVGNLAPDAAGRDARLQGRRDACHYKGCRKLVHLITTRITIPCRSAFTKPLRVCSPGPGTLFALTGGQGCPALRQARTPAATITDAPASRGPDCCRRAAA
jgi:hypothetical protein